jgi:uncharacterized membrane protein
MNSFFASNVFWPYVAGVILLVVGVAVAARNGGFRGDWMQKAAALAPVFIAAPMGVFGADHFVEATATSAIVPKWLPATPLFWVYLVGAANLASGVSIAVNRWVRLSATLLGLMLLSFVLLMHIPNWISDPTDRFAFNYILRDLSFSMGAIALSCIPRAASRPDLARRLAAVTRVVMGAIAAVFGVEHFFYPQFVPVIPLPGQFPAWMPMHRVISYGTGAVMVVTGVALLLNRRPRLAATVLGVAVVAVVAVVYLPLLIAKLLDLQQVNYLFDTLLFGGSALAIGGALGAAARAAEEAPARLGPAREARTA